MFGCMPGHYGPAKLTHNRNHHKVTGELQRNGPAFRDAVPLAVFPARQGPDLVLISSEDHGGRGSCQV
jgi:hypothetical protein